MSSAKWITFEMLAYFISGSLLGLIFGVIGYYGSILFELFPRPEQHDMVFWLFLVMGVFGGTIEAVRSLIKFVRQPPQQ